MTTVGFGSASGLSSDSGGVGFGFGTRFGLGLRHVVRRRLRLRGDRSLLLAPGRGHLGRQLVQRIVAHPSESCHTCNPPVAEIMPFVQGGATAMANTYEAPRGRGARKGSTMIETQVLQTVLGAALQRGGRLRRGLRRGPADDERPGSRSEQGRASPPTGPRAAARGSAWSWATPRATPTRPTSPSGARGGRGRPSAAAKDGGGAPVSSTLTIVTCTTCVEIRRDRGRRQQTKVDILFKADAVRVRAGRTSRRSPPASATPAVGILVANSDGQLAEDDVTP